MAYRTLGRAAVAARPHRRRDSWEGRVTPMNTQTKILAALLMVSIIALTTTATLGYFIYERTLSGLVPVGSNSSQQS